MESNIADFLKTGLLGPIDLNMSVDDLLEALGLPDGYTTEDQLRRDIASMQRSSYGRSLLSYGDLDFYFQDDFVDSFALSTNPNTVEDYQYPRELEVDWLANLFKLNKAALKDLATRYQFTLKGFRIPDLKDTMLGIWIPESHILITFNDSTGETIRVISRNSWSFTYPQVQL